MELFAAMNSTQNYKMSLWETERFWCVGARHDFCSTGTETRDFSVWLLLSVMLSAGLLLLISTQPASCPHAFIEQQVILIDILKWEGTVTLMILIWAESQSSVHNWTGPYVQYKRKTANNDNYLHLLVCQQSYTNTTEQNLHRTWMEDGAQPRTDPSTFWSGSRWRKDPSLFL